MLNRTLLTSDKIIKFKLVIGTAFKKIIRLKDKNKNPIKLTDWDFRAQFINNFTENDVLCRLTTNNNLISVDSDKGHITIVVPSTVTKNLKNYDTGDWSIEYTIDGENWFVLMQGKWSAEATLLVNWIEPEILNDSESPNP